MSGVVTCFGIRKFRVFCARKMMLVDVSVDGRGKALFLHWDSIYDRQPGSSLMRMMAHTAAFLHLAPTPVVKVQAKSLAER